MIPNVEKSVQVTSTLGGDSGQFTVDESALGHIMDVLTNLYSDPEGAVVREYLTNAYDAQVEAGMKPGTDSWVPIQVTTPSHFNKSYKIRDFGIGMSVADLTDIYSKYGKSTKTTSNDVVGMLGLGSKCALTYTNSFSIVGYKDGVKTTAIISKNEENIPVFHIVDTKASDEPNGVEISVPVKDRNSFAEKTSQFLRWWGENLVLVNGAAPVGHGLTKVKDTTITYKVNNQEVKGTAEVYFVEGQGYYDSAQSRVVMGNVAYDVDREHIPAGLRDNNMGFVAYVPMGAVNFPPSRERIFYNTMTKAVIKQLGDGLFEKVQKAKLDEIDAETTLIGAWDKWQAMPHSFRNGAWQNKTYKGLKFNQRTTGVANMVLDWDYNGRTNVRDRVFYDTPHIIKAPVFVIGFDMTKKPTTYFKKKLVHYGEQNGMDIGNRQAVYIFDTDPTDPWLAEVPRVKAEDIKAIKLPKNAPAGPRTETPYDFYEVDAKGVVTGSSELIVTKKGKRVVHISPADMRETYRRAGTTVDALMKRMETDVRLVVLGTNRFEKYLRTHPNSIPFNTYWRDRVKALVDATTDNEYIVQTLTESERSFLNSVNDKVLDDADLADLATIVKGGTGKSDGYTQAGRMVDYGRRAGVNMAMPDRKHIPNRVTADYPLIQHVGNRHISHLVAYVNAVYAARQKP